MKTTYAYTAVSLAALVASAPLPLTPAQSMLVDFLNSPDFIATIGAAKERRQLPPPLVFPPLNLVDPSVIQLLSNPDLVATLGATKERRQAPEAVINLSGFSNDPACGGPTQPSCGELLESRQGKFTF